MAFFRVHLLLLPFALFLTANAYELKFKNITLLDESKKDKYGCTLQAFKGGEESHCGQGELQTDGRRNQGLEWAKDKLCIKVTCKGAENDTLPAIRLQQCELVDLKKAGRPMKRPIHLIDSDGCLPGSAKGEWPKLMPPLNYSRAEGSVTVHGWTFGNEGESRQFPDEATLSCEVQLCADPCDHGCLDKISLDKCDPSDIQSDKNATELCNGGSGTIHGTISAYLMTILLSISCIVLMF